MRLGLAGAPLAALLTLVGCFHAGAPCNTVELDLPMTSLGDRPGYYTVDMIPEPNFARIRFLLPSNQAGENPSLYISHPELFSWLTEVGGYPFAEYPLTTVWLNDDGAVYMTTELSGSVTLRPARGATTRLWLEVVIDATFDGGWISACGAERAPGK